MASQESYEKLGSFVAVAVSKLMFAAIDAVSPVFVRHQGDPAMGAAKMCFGMMFAGSLAGCAQSLHDWIVRKSEETDHVSRLDLARYFDKAKKEGRLANDRVLPKGDL